MNENYGFNYQVNEDTFDCNNIKGFIESNKFPLIKRLNTEYIRKIQQDKKTLIIALIDHKSEIHMRFLHNTFQTIAIENRNYVFSYLDFNEDKELTANLKVSKIDKPKIVVYNFEMKKLFFDDFEYVGENENMMHLKELMVKLKNGDIQFSSGSWFDDFFDFLGFKINQKNLTIFCAFFFIIVILIFLIFNFTSDNEGDRKKKVEKLIDTKKEN